MAIFASHDELHFSLSGLRCRVRLTCSMQAGMQWSCAPTLQSCKMAYCMFLLKAPCCKSQKVDAQRHSAPAAADVWRRFLCFRLSNCTHVRCLSNYLSPTCGQSHSLCIFVCLSLIVDKKGVECERCLSMTSTSNVFHLRSGEGRFSRVLPVQG